MCQGVCAHCVYMDEFVHLCRSYLCATRSGDVDVCVMYMNESRGAREN